MKSKDLAEFHNVHERTTRKWSKEQRHRKTIQAEADVTPLEWQLVGEIAQLCYLYNAQNWEGETITNWCSMRMDSFGISITIHPKESSARHLHANLVAAFVTAEMQLIKMQLEKLVYGEEK